MNVNIVVSSILVTLLQKYLLLTMEIHLCNTAVMNVCTRNELQKRSLWDAKSNEDKYLFKYLFEYVICCFAF